MSEVIFAFESWGGGSSALYSGAEVAEFVERHYASGTFAKLHVGGEEVREEYEILEIILKDNISMMDAVCNRLTGW